MSRRGLRVMVGVIAAIFVAFLGWALTSRSTNEVAQDAGQCHLDRFQTVVDCALEHHWQSVGGAELSLNLAPYTVYPYNSAMWLVLYGGDCTQLALASVSPAQVLADDLAIVGIPIEGPTLEQWEAGDRGVTCGIGVEPVSAANADLQVVQVNPLSGSGSLLDGSWVVGNR